MKPDHLVQFELENDFILNALADLVLHLTALLQRPRFRFTGKPGDLVRLNPQLLHGPHRLP